MDVNMLAWFEEDDMELFSSSSYSSEEEQDIGDIFQCTLNSRRCIPDYFEVIEGYTAKEFITNFRLDKEKVEILAEEFKSSEVYQKLLSNPGTRLIVIEKKSILVFLWFAGHSTGYREVADRFNLSLSTTFDVINRVTMFLSGKAKEIIRFPNEDQKRATAQHFIEYKGFPNVIGCIGGCHIKVDKPTERHIDYINRKGYYSLNIQVVCNENRKIIDVFIGYPGSVHDARIFDNSTFKQKLPTICSEEYYVLGDSSYPLSKFLMKPYRDNGYLTPQQKNFSTKLSACRVAIEHTFGILKQRFQQLFHVKMRNQERICHFIRACCVLHNIARNEDLEFFSKEVLNDDQPEQQIIPDLTDEGDGQDLRNEICAQLMHI